MVTFLEKNASEKRREEKERGKKKGIGGRLLGKKRFKGGGTLE